MAPTEQFRLSTGLRMTMAGNNRPALARSRLVRSKVDGIRRREPENLDDRAPRC